jgi:ubiquinone/menaquinone biosynthesis C-methylase UbiE
MPTKKLSRSYSEIEAQSYVQLIPDWPGEVEFYQAFAAEAHLKGEAVLEVACGTGRIAIRLAQQGVKVTGMDLSADMLDVARGKSGGMPNVRWVAGDMRSFELGERYGLAIIPGHSFQFMLTPEDQVACLECIRQHLSRGGLLIIHLDHQDLGWLGEISAEKAGAFEAGSKLIHPKTGNRIRTSHAWSYERSTQTATYLKVWEELDANGDVVNRWEWEPKRLHCIFRYEMEHLLRRVEFQVEAIYGDFFRNALSDESSEMIFVAR